MRLRVAVCATAALGLLLPAAAGGSSCPLIVDTEGDGRHDAIPVLSSPALDILSADIASGSSTVVAAVRVKATHEPVATALGVKWSFAFQLDGGPLYAFTLTRSASAPDRAELRSDTGSRPAPAFTVDATSITWTAPRSSFPQLVAGSSVLTNLTASSTLAGGSADEAGGGIGYVDQSAGCVPAA